MTNTDADLKWSLAAFDTPTQAAEFFERFKGAFSVYSSAVQKVYTEYSTEVVEGDDPLLVIQPDMYEFSSMFHNIGRDAIVRTSVVLYEEKTDIRLSAVLAKTESRQSFTLQEGLYHLFSGDFVDGPFLPLLTYGDLRTLPEQNRPILQMHGLNLAYLTNLSSFQIADLIETLKHNILCKLTLH